MQTQPLNRHRVTLLWIFLSALILRIAWIVQYQASPFFDTPSLDFTFFDQRAREILQGAFFSGTYLFSPLYPLFLTVIYKIFGTDLFFPRLIQAVLGAFLVFPIYGIAAFAFNRRTALMAAIICAVYLPLIYYDGILMATTLHVFCLVVSAACLAGTSSWKRIVSAGLLMGVVLLAAPNYLIVMAAAALWLLTCSGVRFRKSMAYAAVYIACALAVVSPITVYHALKDGEFVFVAPHGGINFYLGNHEQATGTYMSIPGISDYPGQQALDSKKIASEALGRPATNAEVSTYWANKSLEFLKKDPVAFIALQGRKIALFWNAFEIPSEYGLDFDSQFHSILRFPLIRFGWIAPLALVGSIFILFTPDKKKALLPAFMLIGTMAAVIVFFVHARYRIPATPWVIMFASFCISEIIRFIQRRRWGILGSIGLSLVFATGFVYQTLEERNDLPGWFNRAQIFLEKGDTESAEACLQEILKQDNSMKTWFLLGLIQMNTGRLSEAETSFQNVLVQNPDHYEALLNLGLVYTEKQQYESAQRLLERAVRLYPDLTQARMALAVVYLEQDQFEKALDVLKNIKIDDLSMEQKTRLDHIVKRIEMNLER